MKKHIPHLTFFLLLFCFTTYSSIVCAQNLANPGFESWHTVQGDTMPTGWSTSGLGAGKITDSHSGSFATQLWNWYWYAEGYLVNGSADFVSPFMWAQGGTPIATKPTQLNGFYQYEFLSDSADRAVVVVILKKYNLALGKIDTIGFGEALLTEANAYTPFQVDIVDWAPGVQPDSIVIAFASAQDAFCPPETDGNCNYFSFDDLSLSTPTGIMDAGELFAPQVFPNPARGQVNISLPLAVNAEVKLIDLSGKVVMERELGQIKTASINTAALPKGLYFLQITRAKGQVTTHKLELMD